MVSLLSSKSTSEVYVISIWPSQYSFKSNLADKIVPLSLKFILVIVPITVVLTVKLIVPSSIRNGELSKETLKFPSISSPSSIYKIKVRSLFPSTENTIEVTEQSPSAFEAPEERAHSPIIALVCSDDDPPDTSITVTSSSTSFNCCWISTISL